MLKLEQIQKNAAVSGLEPVVVLVAFCYLRLSIDVSS